MIEFKKLDMEISICKLLTMGNINWQSPFVHLSKTDEEISLACITGQEPADAIAVEAGWAALRLPTTPDTSLVRLASELLDLLEKNKIGLFVLSTFNTDYLMIRQRNYEQAIQILSGAGYAIS
ncbi:MAG: ACT domain-containing protein [Oscillospiraceae bacterium]|nr:ACT domain-containing protein [Oscillospiraceae bacterium]